MRPPRARKATTVPLVELVNEDDDAVAVSVKGSDGKSLTLLVPGREWTVFRRSVMDFKRRDEETDAQTIELPLTTCLWGERRRAG